eukprot:m51a1_g3117 hypothetical protein (428) ;mRNA; r:175036-177407
MEALISDIAGVPQQQVRFGVALFASLPAAAALRSLAAPRARHAASAALGVAVSLYLYGARTAHLAAMAAYSLALVRAAPASAAPVVTSACVAHVVALGHLPNLLVAYGQYDLSWTASAMVLVCKMANLAWSVSDSAAQGRTRVPTVLEGLGYAFGVSGFICSPLPSFSTYMNWAEHREQYSDGIPSSWNTFAAAWRLFGALASMVITIVASMFVPEDRMATSEFAAKPFFYRMGFMYASVLLGTAKYLFGWWLGELSCVLSGIAYSGRDTQGRCQWNECLALDIVGFYTSDNKKALANTWNISAQKHFLKFSVFQRLARVVSSRVAAPLTYIVCAIWHGLYPGYYMTFTHLILLGISTSVFDSKVMPLVKDSPALARVARLFMWFNIQTVLAYCLIPFRILDGSAILKTFSRGTRHFFGVPEGNNAG